MVSDVNRVWRVLILAVGIIVLLLAGGEAQSGGGSGGGGGSIATDVESLEIRGTVWNETASDGAVNETASWNPQNFAGFIYDLDDNNDTEHLSILQTGLSAGNRTIDSDKLVYSTKFQTTKLKVVKEKYPDNLTAAADAGLERTKSGQAFENGSYIYVGWQGEKFVALNGNTSKLSNLILEHGSSTAEKKTLMVGETWDLGEGWTLTANTIDAKASPRQAWLVLSKDGVRKDDKVIAQGKIYTYVERNIASETDVPLFVTYLDSVFAGATSEMIQLRYTWVISTNITEVNVGSMFGNMEVVENSSGKFVLNNTNSINLTQGSEVNIMDNLKFRMANQSDVLRFYPVITRTQPGDYGVRGTTWNETASNGTVNGTVSWNPQNFAGLFYYLDNNGGTENLSILQPDLSSNQRTIDLGNLTYTTGAQPKLLNVVKEAFNNSVENATVAGLTNTLQGQAFENGSYQIVGWQGERYVTLNGNISKLSKLVLEQDAAGIKNMIAGETWNIGDGWTLTLESMDPRVIPGQALFVLRKDGVEKDTRVVIEGKIYTFNETIADESNVPLFVTFFENMSRKITGDPDDIVHLRYTWVISSSVTRVSKSDRFGKMEVADVNIADAKLFLNNTNDTISLIQDSTVNLMGNMNFKVADLNDVLRFYPYVQKAVPSETPNIIVRAYPGTIFDDGWDTSKVTVQLIDQQGNNVADDTVVGFISNRSTDVFPESGTNSTSNTTINGITTVNLKGNISGTSKITVDGSVNSSNIYGFVNVAMEKIITNYSTNVLVNEISAEVLNVEDDAAVGVDTTGDLFINNITASITKNAPLFNLSNATAQSGIATGEASLERYLNVTVNISNPENLSSVNITISYNDADLDKNKDGDITDAGVDIDENTLKMYWWNGSVWRPLFPEGINYSSENGPTVLKIFKDAANNKMTVKLNHFSLFTLAGTLIPAPPQQPPSGGGGSGGGGGGGGTSGENYSNIEVKEKYDLHIFRDKVASYAFTNYSNVIVFVNITGNISAGEITTAVEVLRNTSSLVKNPAPGIVYKNVNIWVGTSGFATPKNIKEAIIRFKVKNSWLDNNNLATDEIRMVRWNGIEWIQLETKLKEKDSTNTYFESMTDRFSPFAIIGLNEIKAPKTIPNNAVVETSVKTAIPTPAKPKGTPGFEVIAAVITTFSAFCIFGRKR